MHEVVSRENCFGGLTNNIIYRSVSITTSEGCPYKISIVGVGPIDIHRRVVHIISIFGVCPIDIHQRVVHKIDYRSVSTIYIGGLSMIKNKYLCLDMVFIHRKMHV